MWHMSLSNPIDLIIRGLSDADSAIQLKSDWPKGHFRRGKALIGLKVCYYCTCI